MGEKILSFGGGVNTAALLALAYQRKLSFDVAIFADTGCELPETYEWIERYAKPVCKELGIEFVVVRGEEEVHGKPVSDLYEYCWEYRFLPSRKWRFCTDKFKVKPIKSWIFENCEDPELILGIDASEKHRARECTDIPCRYPLVELGIDRRECKRIIKSVGWVVPPKSGCFICPYSSVSRFKWLYEAHPELFQKAEALEKNALAYQKGFTLKEGYRLEDIRKKLVSGTRQTDLEGGFACVMCHL